MYSTITHSQKVARYKNNALQLPKINRTFLVSSQNDQFTSSLRLRNLDYSTMSMHQIQKEYEQLRKQLIRINQIAARKIEPLRYSNVHKSHKFQSQETRIAVSDQELKNNEAIILMLKDQLELLQARLAEVSLVGKQELEEQITKMKEIILSQKTGVKKLQLGVSQKGRSILNSDQVFQQISYLQREKLQANQKKRKMQSRSQDVSRQIAQLKHKIVEINNKVNKAQDYIQDCTQDNRAETFKKNMAFIQRRKKEQIQGIKKNTQSFTKKYQIKYQKLLIEYSTKKEQHQHRDNMIIQRDRQIVELKNILIELQQKVKEYPKEIMTKTIDKNMIMNKRQNKQMRNQKEIKNEKINKKPVFDVKKKSVDVGVNKMRKKNNVSHYRTVQVQQNDEKEIIKKQGQIGRYRTIQNKSVGPEVNKMEKESSYKKQDSFMTEINPITIDVQIGVKSKQKQKEKQRQIEEQDKGQEILQQKIVKEKRVEKKRVEQKAIEKEVQEEEILQQKIVKDKRKDEKRVEQKVIEEKMEEKKEEEKKVNDKRQEQEKKKQQKEVSQQKNKINEQNQEQQYEDQDSFQDLISSSSKSQQQQNNKQEQQQFQTKIKQQKLNLSKGIKTGIDLSQVKNINNKIVDQKPKKNHFSIQL